MISKTYYLQLALVFVQQLLSAQTTSSLSGIISANKETVPFCNIVLVEDQKGTSTDAGGKFFIENIKPGKYTIKTSAIGYISKEIPISLLPGKNTLNIELQIKTDQLEEITVTGTLKPTFLSRSPVKVEVVTAKKLTTFLPSASASLIDNIQLINGVQEVTACGVCQTNSISINGLPGPYTAILMDGMPIYGNLAAVYGLNGIPNTIIDRMEVIKGPNSTLYGSEAVAGVINIITKDPKKQPLLTIDLMGTSHREAYTNISIAPKIGGTAGFIGINHSYVNNYNDVNSDGFNDGINLDRTSLFTKWNISRKSKKPFSLAARYYFEDRRNGVKNYLTNRNYKEIRGSETIYGESIYTNRMEIFGSYTLNSKENIKIDFSLSDHLQDSYYGSDGYLAKQQIGYSNIIWNRPIKNHDITAGVTNRIDLYDDNSVATEKTLNNQTINHPSKQYIPGVFLQDEYAFTEKITFLPGIRLDHYSKHGFITSPRLSVKYTPFKETTIRSNMGTGFKIVNLFTEDHAFVTGQREVVINETLNPEKSYNISTSIIQKYHSGIGIGSIDIDLYYTHFTNKILPNYDQEKKIIYENSKGYALTKGINLTLNHSFAFPLSISIGGNIQSAIQTEPNENTILETTAIEFAQKWSGVSTINFNWKKQKIIFALTSTLTGNMQLPTVYDLDENGTPNTTPKNTTSMPFHLHNLQITKTFKNGMKIYTGIENLTNFVQKTSPLIGYNDPNNNTGFSPYFDTSYAYAPNHGREVYLGINWNWK